MNRTTQQIRKTIIAVLLMATAVFTANAQNVNDEFTNGYLNYKVIKINPNEVKLISSTNKGIEQVTIPETVSDNNGNTYVVTTIGEYCFLECDDVRIIRIPNTIVSIETQALVSGSAMGKAIISDIEEPSKVKLGMDALWIGGGQIIYVPDGKIPEYKKLDQWKKFPLKEQKDFDTGSSIIGKRFFYNKIRYEIISLTEVKLIETKFPKGHAIIPDKVIYKGKNYSVTKIGKIAFRGEVDTITIPNSIKEIEEYPFYAYSMKVIISKILDPSKVKIADKLVAKGLHPLEYYVLWVPSGTKSLYQSLPVWRRFNIQEEGNEQLLNSIIKNGQLYYKITSVNPNKVKVIMGETQNLTNINIPATLKYKDEIYTVTEIAKAAFCYYSSESIIIPNTVVNIGDIAFAGTNIISINLPPNITKISAGLFSGCHKLTSIEIPNGVKVINDKAFAETNITSITINSNIEKIAPLAFLMCHALKSIEVEHGNKKYSSEDGVLYSKNKKMLVKYPAGKTAEQYIIPDFVETIFHNAFDSPNLKQITISRNVDYVGIMVFAYCPSLSSIEVVADNNFFSSEDGILFSKDKKVLVQYPLGKTYTKYIVPNSVVEIGATSFMRCRNLKFIDMPNSVKKIEQSAFHKCTFNSINMSDSITYIGTSAFNDCFLLDFITIPKSVQNIGQAAFVECRRLDTIFSNSKQPILLFADTFEESPVYKGKLYVPKGATGNYKSTKVWNKFENIIEVEVQLPADINALAKGNTKQLQATVLPTNFKQTVIWSSSNTDVVTVNKQGLITAVSKGTAIITATTQDGGFSSTCNVTVVEPVTDVKLTLTTKELKINETVQLTAKVEPSDANQNVIWSSSQESVATVDVNGLVTAVSEGKATITVTTEDGGKTATCEITVVPNTISVTGVSCNK